MNRQPGVLVVGDSILMEGVALSLMERQTVPVDRVDPRVKDIRARAADSRPDLIVYEMGTPLSVSILALLYELPGTLLVGVDSVSDRIVVMDSQECIARSMLDLRQAIDSVLHRATDSSRDWHARERKVRRSQHTT